MSDKTMQTVADVLPCPFCGSTEGFYVVKGSTFSWRAITCRSCGEGTEVRHKNYSDEPDSYIADWNAAAPYPAMLRKEIDNLRTQLAEAQAAQTSNQYPPITTEIIYQHVQANQVRHFLRVSWKDGIDIEEPTHSVKYLLHAYADAAREGWASPKEVRTLREKWGAADTIDTLSAENEERLRGALEALADYVDERTGDNECRPLENARAALAAIKTGETK